MNLKEIIKECHKIAKQKGFWNKDKLTIKDLPVRLMLIVTEISECCEAHRCMDVDGIHSELADIAIRLFDLCGGYKIDLEYEIKKKLNYNKNRKYKHRKLY